MNIFGITDIGKKREINQDCIFMSIESIGKLPNLFIVADGMGGHNAGDYASKFAIETFVKLIKRSKENDYITAMNSALQEMNKELHLLASKKPELEGMGTTFVAAVLYDNKLTVLNVGDSRLYLAKDQLIQITRDHSWVEEMVSKGELSREEARTHEKKNLITRAIGADSEVTADFFTVDIGDNDIILLCSDGLTNMVEDDEIYNILKESTGELSVRGKKLVDIANNNGGKDNISVVLVEPNEFRGV